MATYIVGAVVFLLLGCALRGTVRHFRGEGGCCGGSVPAPPPKKLTEAKIGEKIVDITGMHCQNCRHHVEHLLNGINGAAARVSLEKGVAILSVSRPVTNEEILAALEGSDYHITGIHEA